MYRCRAGGREISYHRALQVFGARGGFPGMNGAPLPLPHGWGEVLPLGADEVNVEVCLHPGTTRVVFAFPADGGWYACVEPYGAGAVRGVEDFEAHFCDSEPGPNVWYEPCGR
eukprot:12107714-Alexandrium_andersonii.AAC.1